MNKDQFTELEKQLQRLLNQKELLEDDIEDARERLKEANREEDER